MNKGFTLFVAMVVMGTLLLVAIGMSTLAVKQGVISTSARESQLAFYAADTGVECAIYWDVKNPSGFSAFSTSTGSTISCNGTDSFVGGSSVSVFEINLFPDPYCARVRVEKFNDGTTRIESKGYNSCDSSNSRRVERAIKVSY